MNKPTTKRIKFHIKSGDRVLVISGDAKGKEGLVLRVDAEKQRAIVEGVNKVKRHVKPTAANPQGGGIIEKEAPIHISNLKLIDPATGKATKVGYKANDKGRMQRVNKTSGQFIPEPTFNK